MTAKVVGKTQAFALISMKNNMNQHAVMQESTSAKFLIILLLLNLITCRFLCLSVNESLLLLSILLYFFHFVLCIWEF